MAKLARDRGIALRPHAKTHKSRVRSPDRQMAAGAVGQCCAKLGEAEVLADAGIRGLLLTSPVQRSGQDRPAAGAGARAPDLAVVVEDAANVGGWARRRRRPASRSAS